MIQNIIKKKRLDMLILICLLSIVTKAETVEINGIYYEITTKIKTATVIKSPLGTDYSGDIVIPSSFIYKGENYIVNSIDSEAFEKCRWMTSIHIPSSITSPLTFMGCYGLKAVYIEDLGSWCKLDCWWTIYNGNYCPGNPLYYAHHLFLNGEEIKELIIPNTVTEIRNFMGCSLTSVTIPNSVTSIGYEAFRACSGLTSITIPNSVTSIGRAAFQECSNLTSITIPSSLTNIENEAFSGCNQISEVHISNLEAWCKNASSYKSNPLYLAEHLYLNGEEIKDLITPNNVTSICAGAFSGFSGITSVTIGNSVTSIGGSAFAGCTNLSSVKILNSLTTIEKYTFDQCKNLTSVIIGTGIKTIGDYSFGNCDELLDVYCYAPNVPQTSQTAFANSYIEYATLHVPSASISKYKSMEPWNQFGKIVALDGDTPSEPQIGKCKKPVISYKDGMIMFNCDTEGVTFYYDISSPDVKNGYDSKAPLSQVYNVSVYASKLGYDNSDIATATFSWNGIEPLINGDVAKHRLSFIVDNKELSARNVEFGATITPPTKDSNGNTISWYTYPATMPAHDLVVYGMVPKPDAPAKYTITYVLDGQTYRTIVVEEGEAVNKEKAPYKEGYTFNGWQNEPTTMPERDVTVNGTFSVNTYRLTFIVDNEELSARNVTYGAAITAPTKDGEGNEVTWYSYPATMPAHDLVAYGMTIKETEEPEPTEPEPEPIVPEPEVFVWLTVNDCQSGYTKIKVKQGAEQTLNFTAEEGWKISNIFMDGRYVTSRLAEDGTFVTPAITGDASIIVVYEEVTPSGVRAATRSQADVKVVSDGVVISNAEPNTRCVVYSASGQQVVNAVINEVTRKITLQKGQAYILTIDGRTLKFAL